MAKKEMSTNPDLIQFREAPFYNLAKVRTDLIKLIARTNGDQDKIDAVHEVVTLAGRFLRIREEADKAERRRLVEAAEKIATEAKEADEKAILDKAAADLETGNALVLKAKSILGVE